MEECDFRGDRLLCAVSAGKSSRSTKLGTSQPTQLDSQLVVRPRSARHMQFRIVPKIEASRARMKVKIEVWLAKFLSF